MPPLPKPEPLRRQKARTARQHAAARKACVDAVWKRAESCCEKCGKFVLRPAHTEWPLEMGHVHEVIYRSRGGSDTDVDNCVLLCGGPGGCHEKVHAKKITLTEDRPAQRR